MENVSTNGDTPIPARRRRCGWLDSACLFPCGWFGCSQERWTIVPSNSRQDFKKLFSGLAGAIRALYWRHHIRGANHQPVIPCPAGFSGSVVLRSAAARCSKDTYVRP